MAINKKRRTEAEQRWRYFKATVYADELVQEYCLRTVKSLTESLITFHLTERYGGGQVFDSAVGNVTVGEMLKKIEELEKLQLEREPIMTKVSELEKQINHWVKVVQKDAKSLKSGESEDEARTLAEFEIDLIDLQTKISVIKEHLQDPNANLVAIGSQFATLCNTALKTIIENAKTLASELDLAEWDKILDWTQSWFEALDKWPLMSTFAGMGKDLNKLLQWGQKGAKWIGKTFFGKGEKPDKAIKNMVKMVATKPDTKFRTAPFLELFNIDDEYIKMLDEELQVKFIAWYKKFLSKNADDILIKDLDIDEALEKWIPKQREYQDHGVNRDKQNEN